MKIPFSPPDMSVAEANEVRDAIMSGWITTGPRTKEFEKLISMCCGTERTVCLNSATASMEMCLRILGVGPGDEVIMPAYTYTASCSVVCHVGATPVMVDCAPGSFEMDYDRLADAITEKTKVIIPVDLGGVPADYDRVFQAVALKGHLFRASNPVQEHLNRVVVLADAAHAFGAKYKGKMVGSVADFTSFSFHAVKNLTTAEGGALTWRADLDYDHDHGYDYDHDHDYDYDYDYDHDHDHDYDHGCGWDVVNGEIVRVEKSQSQSLSLSEAMYKLLQLLSLHGQNKDALAKTQLGAWEYDIIAPYYKCNMTDIMAAIGLAQLKRYPEMLVRRREIINRYEEGLKDVPHQSLAHYTDERTSSGHLFLLRLLGKTRQEVNDIITKMAEQGVATNVHYKPLPMMTAYKNLGFDIKDYPNAYAQFENEITLPLHTQLTDEMVDYVIACLKKAL